MNELVFKRLLALLQADEALRPGRFLKPAGSKPDDSLFAGMNEEDWTILYRQAVEEGVMALAFDGVLCLPETLHPPKKLKLSWGASLDYVERRYAHFQAVAQELAALFGEHGIRMLVIKGLSLSQYYPVPAHREFGDLDIYLFGKHKQGDQLLKEVGAVPGTNNSYKHTVFTYKGVLIENHAHFIDVINSGKILELDENLLHILEESKEISDASPDEVLFPPPRFTALFFIAHASQHFCINALVLRAFCDWAVFLRTNKDKIDFPTFRETLEKAGLWAFAVGLTVVTGEWIGLPDMPDMGNDSRMEAWLRREKPAYQPYPPCYAKSACGIVVYKLKRFFHIYKRKRTLYGLPLIQFIENSRDSLIYHIKHPKTVSRNKI
ncbi:MAG: nucleotidyltransferase family protein [Dysgonamonadaceae bacterium]|jgi:hypothetical protein|nr:nucleotidyltransferase family protein [Dysgonamonadaceae bacterium]